MSDDARAALEKRAEVLRALIRQENDLTNQRTTWLLVSQGIFFAAASSFARAHWIPAVIISIVGIIITVSIGQSLQNGLEARRYLKDGWVTLLQASGFRWEDFPPLDGGVPGVAIRPWLFPWLVIPRTLIVAWVALAVYFYLTPLSGLSAP